MTVKYGPEALDLSRSLVFIDLYRWSCRPPCAPKTSTDDHTFRQRFCHDLPDTNSVRFVMLDSRKALLSNFIRPFSSATRLPCVLGPQLRRYKWISMSRNFSYDSEHHKNTLPSIHLHLARRISISQHHNGVNDTAKDHERLGT